MNTRVLAPLAIASALALSACATAPAGGGYGYNQRGAPAGQCYDCGTVTRIEQASNVPSATGAVVGGVVGAVAARQAARNATDSSGRQNAATVAGAAAGAAAGHAIQNRTAMTYNIYVRMADGRQSVVSQGSLDGIREGSYVELRNGRAYLR